MEEIKRQNDDLKEWLEKKESFFYSKVDLEAEYKNIVNTFPNLSRNLDRSIADPAVVALAKKENLVVVTYENFGTKNKIKIPDVCQKLGINCISFSIMMKDLKWKFQKFHGKII